MADDRDGGTKEERVLAVLADMHRIDQEGFPHLEEDEQAGAAYLCLTNKDVVQTIAETEWLNVDLDSSGDAVGVEILATPAWTRRSALNEAAEALDTWSRLMPPGEVADAYEQAAMRIKALAGDVEGA